MKKILSSCFVSLVMLGTPTVMFTQSAYAQEIPSAEVSLLVADIQEAIDALGFDTTEEQIQIAAQRVIDASGASRAMITASLTNVVQLYQVAGHTLAVLALTNVFNDQDNTDLNGSGGATDGSGIQGGSNPTGNRAPIAPPPSGGGGGGSDY